MINCMKDNIELFLVCLLALVVIFAGFCIYQTEQTKRCLYKLMEEENAKSKSLLP